MLSQPTAARGRMSGRSADTGCHRRVLLVEDSDIAAAQIAEHVKAAFSEADVEHVRTLRDGVARLTDGWDVVLLDLGLPDSDGLDTLVRMREASPRVPIVVLTANDDAALALEAVEEHAQDFLGKRRLDSAVLGRSIRYAIGRQLIYARLESVAAEARRNEANLYQLIARSADGIVVLDAEMRALYCNQAACSLLGRSTGELIGEVVPELPPRIEHAEIRVRAADGVRTVDVRMVAVDWESEPAQMALLRDVTERRNAEDLRLQLERSERLASLGQLAAGVAHEINNPLSYVISNLELLLREVDRLSTQGVETGQLTPRVSRALEGSLRVASIVRDLGTFSRQDADDPAAATDVNAALSGALTMASTQLKHRAKVRLSLGDVPPVQANAGRLAQVFLNLLVNAAHAMAEGAADRNQLFARTRCEGEQVIIEIEDSGEGIAPDALGRIFEPFYTTKKVGEGSGLGLYICRNILRNFDGTLEIDSQLGRGTVARIRLPVWSCRSEPPRVPAARSLSAPPRCQGRLLVIDDEAAILDVLEAGLSAIHDVVCVSSGREAIALLAQDPSFDAVLCDVVMPDRSAPDVLEWIQRHRPELASRTIFMTGGGIGDQSSLFIETHRERTLRKPLNLAELLRHIDRVMSS